MYVINIMLRFSFTIYHW